ncbi:hypothetical protein BCSAG_48350 [Bacillus cereus]
MALEKVGNLGQVQLMQRLINQKVMGVYDKEDKSIILSEEEHKELEQMLRDFHHILANLFLHENRLRSDQYGGIVMVLDEVKKKDLY